VDVRRFDVMSILKISRQDVTACHTELSRGTSRRGPAVSQKFTCASGDRKTILRQARWVARAVALSAEKYCSATIMLAAGGVEITHNPWRYIRPTSLFTLNRLQAKAFCAIQPLYHRPHNQLHGQAHFVPEKTARVRGRDKHACWEITCNR